MSWPPLWEIFPTEPVWPPDIGDCDSAVPNLITSGDWFYRQKLNCVTCWKPLFVPKAEVCDPELSPIFSNPQQVLSDFQYWMSPAYLEPVAWFDDFTFNGLDPSFVWGRVLNAWWLLHSAAYPNPEQDNYWLTDEDGNLIENDILHFAARMVRETSKQEDSYLVFTCDDEDASAQTWFNITLFWKFWYSQSVIDRASTLVHETRHLQGLGYAHYCEDGECIKDWDWTHHMPLLGIGAYHYTVSYYGEYWLNSHWKVAPIAQRLHALEQANAYLEHRFINPPVWRLGLEPGVTGNNWQNVFAEDWSGWQEYEETLAYGQPVQSATGARFIPPPPPEPIPMVITAVLGALVAFRLEHETSEDPDWVPTCDECPPIICPDCYAFPKETVTSEDPEWVPECGQCPPGVICPDCK